MSAARRIARAVFAGICLVVPAWAFSLRAPNHKKPADSEKVTIRLDSSAALKTVSSAERLVPAVPLFGPADTVTMFIIGDVMLHSRQMEYSYDSFLEHISGRMKAADISVANMEFPLGGKPYTGYPAFSAPDEYARYVNRCGANVFLAANNHILDRGYTGIDRTLHVYDSLEAAGAIRYTGISADSQDNAGRYPLIVNVRGVRIALLNFTYGTNYPAKPGVWPKVNLADTTDISEALSRAKERKPDFIIALPHWGIEYELRHSARQERLARWLVSKGVNAIVGTHPHVIQDSCSINGVPVFYSLGNAVSNMSAANTQLELAVELKFARSPQGDVTMLRPSVTFLWCSLPGRFTESYATLEVRRFLGRRSLWKSPYDYDKMISTYHRVKSETGIRD